MKTRNVRRRQWNRYVNRLYQLMHRLPPREAGPDPFSSTDPVIVTPAAYLRRNRRDTHRWRKRTQHRWARIARRGGLAW